jgi:serine/threonine protein phosphatase PrpC
MVALLGEGAAILPPGGDGSSSSSSSSGDLGTASSSLEQTTTTSPQFGAFEAQGPRPTMEDAWELLPSPLVDPATPGLDLLLCPGGESGGGPSSSSSSSKETWWAAVYDGHSGSDASKFLQTSLGANVAKALSHAASAHAANVAATPSPAPLTPAVEAAGVVGAVVAPPPAAVMAGAAVKAALKMAFSATDGALLHELQKASRAAGSTAVGCLRVGDTLFVANVGDSRCVLCVHPSSVDTKNRANTHTIAATAYTDNISAEGSAGKEWRVVRLTKDQKPTRADEKARIKRAGGDVVQGRVNGSLGVSRAFGDPKYKVPLAFSDPEAAAALVEAGGDPNKPVVVAEPEVTTTTLLPSRSSGGSGSGGGGLSSSSSSSSSSSPNGFLVLACDGLWDVVGDEQACEVVRGELEKHRALGGGNGGGGGGEEGWSRGAAEAAARALTRLAVDELKSKDNVTVLVVLL